MPYNSSTLMQLVKSVTICFLIEIKCRLCISKESLDIEVLLHASRKFVITGSEIKLSELSLCLMAVSM